VLGRGSRTPSSASVAAGRSSRCRSLVLTIICTNSMALTSWTPTGRAFQDHAVHHGRNRPRQSCRNLIPATMTAEIASNAATAVRHKARLHAPAQTPRQQSWPHHWICAGALAAPRFLPALLPPDAPGVRSTATIVSANLPCCALQWKGVAEIMPGADQPARLGHRFMMVAGWCAAPSRWRGRYQRPLPAFAVSSVLGSCCRRSQLRNVAGRDDVWWMGRQAPIPAPRGTTSGRGLRTIAPAHLRLRLVASATPS